MTANVVSSQFSFINYVNFYQRFPLREMLEKVRKRYFLFKNKNIIKVYKKFYAPLFLL